MPEKKDFLSNIIDDLLTENSDLSQYTIVLPGKRPIVFFKKILQEKKYLGLLPKFVTVEDLFTQISDHQELKGISIWLFAYKVFQKVDPKETLQDFLKWFPTVLKDWDDMLSFAGGDKSILDFMLSEERIKNWGELLGEEKPHRRNLNFWKKMTAFFPLLKRELTSKNLATSGLINQKVKENTEEFSKNTIQKIVFCGFNALTPVEEHLIKTLLQWDKSKCYFQADKYYIEDTRQEAGTFLRKYIHWKEFNEYRSFQWIEDNLSSDKNIKVIEVAGNVSQTKLLPAILENIKEYNPDFESTAIVLLDENLLTPALDSIQGSVEDINITMGFPIKNLSFSIAVKKLFHLQKQLEKKSKSYYYADVIPLLEELPKTEDDRLYINQFLSQVEERNLVYLSPDLLQELIGNISFFYLLKKMDSVEKYLDQLIEFCLYLKESPIDDILFENISKFENAFKTLKNQLSQYQFLLDITTMEVLINHLVSNETIDFEGEPLKGLQLMGLLETRLLTFDHIILLSANEGKLPVGRTQNTYLPFDVRKNHGLNTFLENDSIYAYHFYRLLQGAKTVHLLYNGLSSGTNSGEKSRFITQLEMESNLKIEHSIVDNKSEPMGLDLLEFPKSKAVLDKLEVWKTKISPSHLNTYLYNPVDFYFEQILNARPPDELEEEVSAKNFGNLVHYTLQLLYQDYKGKMLTDNILEKLYYNVEKSLDEVITVQLNQSLDYYKRGMNYIHKSVAIRTLKAIIQLDWDFVKEGNTLEIVDLEKEMKGSFSIDDQEVNFRGFADRIDRVNGELRIVDYKTAKASKLSVDIKKNLTEEEIERYLVKDSYKQEIQLSIYAYCALQELKENRLQCGIWSFINPQEGVKLLTINSEEYLTSESLSIPMKSVATIIKEILNPEIFFKEKEKTSFVY